MKKTLWAAHSIMGLVAGAFLIMVGLTGSILVFFTEVNQTFHPELARVEVSPQRLSFDDLRDDIHRQLPDHEIVGWPVSKNPTAADVVRVRELGTDQVTWAFVNPYTGKVQGRERWNRTVSGWLVELHYSLFLGTWGTVVMGFMAVLLMLLGISGVWLYRGFWKNFLTLRWGRSARIFFSDLHKMTGITSVAFNLILGFTGAWWNLQSVPQLFTRDEEPVRQKQRLYNDQISLDALVVSAKQALPGLDVAETYLGFPRAQGDPFSVSGRLPTANPFRSHYGSRVDFDSQSGAVLATHDIRKSSWWSQFEDMMGPLHYGTFGGLPVKVLWCALGLAPGVLAVSGFLIWRSRRRLGDITMRRHRPVSEPNPLKLV